MFPDVNALLSSDSLLSILLLLFTAFITFKLILPHLHSFSRASNNDISPDRATHSFSHYERASKAYLAQMRHAYFKEIRFNASYRRIGTRLGYPEKLDRLQKTIEANSIVTRGICKLAKEEHGISGDNSPFWSMGDDDLSRVRESLKHFIRDWSSEGQSERDQTFAPIFNILQSLEPDLSQRVNRKVLIPGSGLGRLAWEISKLGFDTTANERSPYMNLAFRFLLSPTHTSTENQHKIHPYAHWFSHQRTNEALFRSVTFPDSIPRLSTTFRLDQGDFFNVSPPPSDGSYSYIVTLFFIDTSLNIIRTVQQIFSLLRPGGVWINLGPLLWTSSGVALELSLDEVFQVVSEVGFNLCDLSRFIRGLDLDNTDDGVSKTIECEYTGDRNAMMRWIYQCEAWVASKPE